MKQRSWEVADRLDPDVKRHLLLSRLQNTKYTPEQYFSPSLTHLGSPAEYQNIQIAASRILDAIRDKESMVVWGDFDADGVTSTAIMWETLHQLGASVLPYIPNRDNEGHGFSEEGVKKLIADGVSLIITVDHGITAIEEVEALNSQGINVIITDHHEPRLVEAGGQEGESPSPSGEPEIHQSEAYHLPDALAVIHPLLSTSKQPLAGCGVAYQFAYVVWLAHKFQITYKNFDEIWSYDTESNRVEFAQDKIELAAIGTIADMVPLKGDNRVLAAVGLQKLVNTKRPGLKQMYKLSGLDQKEKFGAYEIGFGIGPRLNAPGRLGEALESLRLLCTNDASRASKLANELDSLNKQRQDLLAQVAEEAKAEVLKHADGVYVLTKPHWPAGVCGLAAGKIVESFYRPAVVMENLGEFSRGSARSISGFNFTAALTKISDYLESFGGHAMAAGFVAKTENLPQIERLLTEQLWQQFDKDNLNPIMNIDAEIELGNLDWDLHSYICQFEPFGMGNPKPVFVTNNIQIVDYKVVGGDGKHLKLNLGNWVDGATNQAFAAIAFGFGYLAEQITNGDKVDVVYQLDENVWQSRRSLQLMVKDIRLSK